MILKCRLRIAEAELALSDLEKAETFLRYKKEFSHGVYCLKTIFAVLVNDVKLKKWILDEYGTNPVCEWIQEYRNIDLHKADHGFSLNYRLGPITVGAGGKAEFGPGSCLVITDSEGRSQAVFQPDQLTLATGDGLFEIFQKGQEQERWQEIVPTDFPWVHSIAINLPNKMDPKDFLKESIDLYKRILFEVEKLLTKK